MSRLPEPKKDLGRKKGSFAAWHYEPGYQIVIAMEETRQGGKKSMKSRIRWALKEGWLKDIPRSKDSDGAHERRIGLIKKRLEAEETARLEAMGKNIIKLKPRKTRH
jgi:hypothetical protein